MRNLMHDLRGICEVVGHSNTLAVLAVYTLRLRW